MGELIQENRKKTVVKLFLPWQDQMEERWLEEMARQGWLLVQYTYLRYEFKSIEPADYVYRLDYKTTSEKDMSEYKEIFAQSGWEHVCSFMNWQYLRIPSNLFTVDIYTDKASQIEKLRKMTAYAMASFAPLFFAVIILRLPARIDAALERYHLPVLSFIFPFIFILMILGVTVCSIWIIKLSQRIKELNDKE